ncbi:hypothetical protein [Actinopolymorpha rutila]|uniref:Uncharacterized protein n=1 Tax=Actinopolymorpha rutila TaxID=446787 RepID=A0A852ZD62_9ACTN|nr:hypothetical protein [Actinopolymorpha rutila]NYH87639.1 hypothetical protein [Actinopolymorpha rutila]
MSNDLPNILYEYIGRVVVKAAELERALAEVYTTLTLGPPDGTTAEDERRAFVKTWASKPGTLLVAEMQKPDAGVPGHRRNEFDEYLGDVTTALDSRHGVAHVGETEATLMEQVATLSRLVHWAYIWLGRFEAEWLSGRLPARPQLGDEATR